MSWAQSFANLILAAPTGSGKTTRFIIPNVLEAEGSVVVTDPSGEVYRATAARLAQRGFAVQVLQPDDIAHSLRFNPLAHFQGDEELARLAEMFAASGSARVRGQ
jgi:type IV secretory pathway TraG/TraD family ATPase VirD4